MITKEIKERFNEVPETLLMEIIQEIPQHHLGVLAEIKVSGFRVGKIPSSLFVPKVLKALEKSEFIRDRIKEYLVRGSEELWERVAESSLNDLKQTLTQLMGQYEPKEVILGAFLDPRKGAKKIAEEVWKEFAEQKENETDNKIKANIKEAEQGGEKLKRAKNSSHKLEKKLTSEKKKFNGIISTKDKKIAAQRQELKIYANRVKELEATIEGLKEISLTQKMEITKQSDELAAIGGQLKKSEEDIQKLKEENSSLKEELIEKQALIDLKNQNSDNGGENFPLETIIRLKGKFVFTAVDGWLDNERQFFHIPDNLIKQHQLISGDLIEVEFHPGQKDKIAHLAVLEKVKGRETSGYIVYDNKDYWVKVDNGKVQINEDELYRTKAKEGDPVSVLIPFDNPKNRGVITKVHRVYDLTEQPGKKGRKQTPNVIISQKKLRQKTLQNMKVLVVGGDSLKHRYIKELEDLGAIVEWQTGFGELQAIYNKVSRADLVLLITSINSHTATNLARQAAQAYEKKVVYYHSASIKGAVVAVEKFCNGEV